VRTTENRPTKNITVKVEDASKVQEARRKTKARSKAARTNRFPVRKSTTAKS
jgi:hypothetical protein